MLCHIQCLNKSWALEEKDSFGWKKTPYVKPFDCLAEARKGLITYIRNPDFQHLDFRLKEDGIPPNNKVGILPKRE